MKIDPLDPLKKPNPWRDEFDEAAKVLQAARDSLMRRRLSFSTEDALQSDCLGVLQVAQPHAGWRREVPFTVARKTLRFDLYSTAFLVGIECKTDGAFAPVLQQLAGYLSLEGCNGILLVTSRHALRSMPQAMHEKPIFVHWLGASGL